MSKELEALDVIKNISLSHVETEEDEDFDGNWVYDTVEVDDGPIDYNYHDQIDIIERALIKAQEMEKENELLKAIMESFFDKEGVKIKKEYVMQLEATIQNLRRDNALLKDIKNEQARVIKVVFEKTVNILLLELAENVDEYNERIVPNGQLTQEEFDTLKRWSENE